jgi:hypothetical protein
MHLPISCQKNEDRRMAQIEFSIQEMLRRHSQHTVHRRHLASDFFMAINHVPLTMFGFARDWRFALTLPLAK